MSLKYNLTTQVIPVTFDTNGEAVVYELREMTASSRDTYLDTLPDRMRLDKDGKPAGFRKFEGMQADLLSRCLYRATDGKAVQKQVIQEWPASVVNSLFTEAQKLNRLAGEVEKGAELKND